MKTKHALTLLFSTLFLTACGDKKTEPVAADTAAKPQATDNASAAPAAAPVLDAEKVLNIYNWPDYVAESIVPDFEKATGIKVNYQTFENNEALHAKLVAGNSGYDIVVPGAVFAKPQIDAGFFQALDKTQLPNYGNMDAGMMAKLKGVDPDNKYLLPWAWSFTTVGINKTKVAKALGGMPMPENAWDLLFKPEYTSKLKSCGIAYLDSPSEVLQPALHYLGKSAYSNDVADYKLAGAMLAKVRKDVRIFSSTMIDDIAGGKACAALGWAGDFNIAASRAKENGSTDEIQALLPSTGGIMFIDTMAITKDAKHPKNALAFINYYLSKEVAAKQTNEMKYNLGNKAAMELINTETASNPSIFLDEANMGKLIAPSGYSNEAREALGNVYTAFKKGK